MRNNLYVIFDRDGTLIDLVHHLIDPERVVFKSDLVQALKLLQGFNFNFGMITNQSVIGRGLAPASIVDKINMLIQDFLKAHGIKMDFMYTCPHLPEDGCTCRKPQPELGHRAAQEFGILLERSYFVGDQKSDLNFGKALNCRVVQIAGSIPHSPLADFFSDTLLNAARWIIRDSNGR
jgi:histidinol-phosphate phosphatase family protein